MEINGIIYLNLYVLSFQMRYLMFITLLVMKMAACLEHCGGSGSFGKKLQYVIGDAMTDSPNCLGPDGKPYPM